MFKAKPKDREENAGGRPGRALGNLAEEGGEEGGEEGAQAEPEVHASVASGGQHRISGCSRQWGPTEGFSDLAFPDAPLPRPLPRCHLLCPGYTFRCVSAATGHPVVRRGCRCRARPRVLAPRALATGMCHADGSAGSGQVECRGPLHGALGARSSRGSPRNVQILLARVSCLGSCC